MSQIPTGTQPPGSHLQQGICQLRIRLRVLDTASLGTLQDFQCYVKIPSLQFVPFSSFCELHCVKRLTQSIMIAVPPEIRTGHFDSPGGCCSDSEVCCDLACGCCPYSRMWAAMRGETWTPDWRCHQPSIIWIAGNVRQARGMPQDPHADYCALCCESAFACMIGREVKTISHASQAAGLTQGSVYP
jgi:hypothetical protein